LIAWVLPFYSRRKTGSGTHSKATQKVPNRKEWDFFIPATACQQNYVAFSFRRCEKQERAFAGASRFDQNITANSSKNGKSTNLRG
jgi:hypothetical protein